MIGLTSAELLKLRTTRLFGGLVIAATALVVIVTGFQLAMGGSDSGLTIEGAAEVIETQADLRALLDVSGVATLFALVLGATAVAGEYRHKTIAPTFLVTPQRGRVILAKTISYIIAGALLGLAAELSALVVAAGWLATTGSAIPLGSVVIEGLLLAPIATGLAAGFGVGVGAAVPNQLGAVLLAVGWVMVLEQLINGLAPDVAAWLPFTGAGAAITGLHSELGVLAGLGLFTAYLVVLTIAGIQVTGRRDAV